MAVVSHLGLFGIRYGHCLKHEHSTVLKAQYALPLVGKKGADFKYSLSHSIFDTLICKSYIMVYLRLKEKYKRVIRKVPLLKNLTNHYYDPTNERRKQPPRFSIL